MAETTAEQVEREAAEAKSAEDARQKQIEKDMGGESFVVVAPYVTLRVKDQLGNWQLRGFLEGGVVKREDIEDASLRHHLDSKLVAVVGSDAAKYAGPSGTPKPGEPPNVPVTERPVTSLPLAERLQAQQDAAAADAKAAKSAKTEPSK
jgi:hypothetical protein